MNNKSGKEKLFRSFDYMNKKNKLVLYNDEINTFENVIENLVRHCNFELVQAEQLAILAHYKGKVTLTHGRKNKLSSIREKLHEANLMVEIH